MEGSDGCESSEGVSYRQGCKEYLPSAESMWMLRLHGPVLLARMVAVVVRSASSPSWKVTGSTSPPLIRLPTNVPAPTS